MADSSSPPDLTPANLNLTPDEKRVFGQLFQAADTENVGVVTGEVAVKFFERTKLAPAVLGEIWQIADTENRGFLTPAGFGIVLRLIGHYQAGRDPSPELALRPGPLPRFEGMNVGSNIPTGAQPPSSLQPQASGSGPIRVPPLIPDKVTEYTILFDKSGAQNGTLPGDMAKQIFERARLSNEVLGRIWNLADTQQRGALNVTEFVIAMHLLASFKSGAIRSIPSVLPPGLYEAATRRGPIPRPQSTGIGPGPNISTDVPPVPSIPRQFSGSTGPGRTQSPMSARPPFGTPPLSAQHTMNDWVISPQEKASFDGIYSTLDTNSRGFITGDQAVAFFSNSRLSEEILAQIWDLADINSEGRLNRDEFAVAMYLIRQQRSKANVNERATLPASLPPNLVPPSMRQQIIPPSQPTAPTFDNAAYATQSKSASEDLFGLDALSSPSAAQIPQSTGGSGAYNKALDTEPFKTASPTLSTGSPQQTGSTFKPFVPTSSFGQSLSTSGSKGPSAPPSQNRGFQQDDLLGDNDPEVSNKLTSETTELANLSNQVGTLSKQMQEVKSKRSSTEQELSNASSQKRDFELRLSQLRALYEQEAKDVKILEERLTASRNETRRLQQDIALIEGSYQDLQNQHRQVVEALETDKQENASLKERMRQVNQEISQLKPQLEKMRSEARQQKGLVAINKKQLSTNEGEREKIRGEMTDLSRAAQENARSAQASQVQSPAEMASPAVSTSSQSTNPFFRKPPTSISEAMGAPSPYAREPSQPTQSAFDSVFGPSFSNPNQVPPTSFRSDSQSRDIPTVSAPSGPSVRSSEFSDVPTPSTSPPASSHQDSPRVAEPPPPPESRQITSNLLPFPNNVQRQDSFSSSVKVSAPASRYGGDDVSGAETPTNWPGSGAVAGSQPREPGDLQRTETNKTETGASSLTFDRRSTASPAASDAARPGTMDGTDTYQTFGRLSPRESVPGAFPTDSTVQSPIQPNPTGDSTLSERSKASSRPSESYQTSQTSRSDPFSLGRDQRAPAASKDDFDAAFAGFGAPKQPQERQNTGGSNDGSVGTSVGGSKFQREFPPIEEIERDEDSDDSERGGFEDNFTSSSPVLSQRTPGQPTSQIQESTSNDDAYTIRPSTHTDASEIEPLPSANAQKSPPTYDQTVSPPTGATTEHRDSNQFPPEFSGLLPAREDPTSPHDQEKQNAQPLTGGQTLFSNSNNARGAMSGAPTTFSSSPPTTNTPLSTAPSDAYQSAVSQPSIGNGPSSPTIQAPTNTVPAVYDDFDNEFGDLMESKEADDKTEEDFGVSSQHHGFDEFNPVFDSPMASKSNTMASQQTATGSNSQVLEDHFKDFEHNLGGSAQLPSTGKAPLQTPASSHDWDAIFAGLDSGPGVQSGTTQSGFGAPDESEPVNGAEKGLASSHVTSTEGPSLAPAQKPPLGRALTTGTEHDDPILKNLTAMGYSRDAALGALEKFDYNIDKAANYLATS